MHTSILKYYRATILVYQYANVHVYKEASVLVHECAHMILNCYTLLFEIICPGEDKNKYFLTQFPMTTVRIKLATES